LDFEALDVLGIGRGCDGRDDLVGHQPNGDACRRIDGDFDRVAKEVPRGGFPVLTLPLVHMKPDGVAVGPREPGVDIDEGLYPVLSWGQLRQGCDGVALDRRAEPDVGARGEVSDGHRKKRSSHWTCLPNGRLSVIDPTDGDVDLARDRLRAGAGRKRDREYGLNRLIRAQIQGRGDHQGEQRGS